jgi:hypothetical protein
VQALREAFSSIPASMYFVSIFLGGEWGETDFTVGGKFVCIGLVTIGIELYAIPISVLFDAFADVLGACCMCRVCFNSTHILYSNRIHVPFVHLVHSVLCISKRAFEWWVPRSYRLAF